MPVENSHAPEISEEESIYIKTRIKELLAVTNRDFTVKMELVYMSWNYMPEYNEAVKEHDEQVKG